MRSRRPRAGGGADVDQREIAQDGGAAEAAFALLRAYRVMFLTALIDSRIADLA
jgi:hypothetical protein